MHEQFPNWMSKVAPQTDQSRLVLRWNAAAALAGGADVKLAIQLSEQALGLSSQVTEAVRTAARKEDTTYVSEDDALEVSVLAAGALAALMASGGDAGDAAAISVLTGSFGRAEPKGMIRDLVEASRAAILRIGEEERRDVSVPSWVGKAISEAMAKNSSANDIPSIHTEVTEIAQATITSIKAQFQKLADAITRLNSLQKESSDLAFLLVSEFSFAAKKPVTLMAQSEAAFAVAEDLFRVTEFAAPLPSFDAALLSLLKPAKTSKTKGTVSSAVSALPEVLRKNCMADTVQFPKVMPLHCALMKCDEVAGGDTWVAPFEAVTGIKGALDATAGEIANQMYLENMLAWHLEN